MHNAVVGVSNGVLDVEMLLFFLWVDRSLDRLIAQSFARSIAGWLDRAIDRSIAQSLDRSLARSIAHSLNRSIAHSLARSLASSIVPM